MRDGLKVAFYTDTFLPAVDGVVTSILGFRQEMERRGDKVYTFASGDAETKRVSKAYKDVFVSRSIKLKRYPQYNIALFPFTSSMKFPKGIDIIHAHTPFTMGAAALLTAKVNRIPIVSSFHTLFMDPSVIKTYTSSNRIAQRLFLRYSWNYANFFYSKCNAVIAPSNSIKVLLQKHGIKNVCVVPNGIDLSRFNGRVDGRRIRKKLLGNRRNNRIVLYIGRISREKKIEVLLDAAKRLEKEGIEFVLGGTGPAMTHYQRIVQRKRLGNVRFVGFVDEKLLPNYYAACDVFCIPSTFETQGVVALEAMAVGKPVVGADHLALRELIKNGKNGEKFAPGDGRDCAGKIKKVINNIGSYKEMTKTAKEYSLEAVTDRLLEVYKDIINNT